MSSPRGATESNRALALGAIVRRRRRERGLTLAALARLVPMSASNLSRIELGTQGPPADEIIRRIADALDADEDELLKAAGHYPAGEGFEAKVLAQLEAISRDILEVKAAVLGAR